MREGGGRAVERTLPTSTIGRGAVIGIKPGFGGDTVPQERSPAFGIIAVKADGARQALSGLRWTLVKVEREYQWYRSGRAWNYEPVPATSRCGGTVDATAGGSRHRRAGRLGPLPAGGGDRRPADGPATSIEFAAGWYVEAASTETPDGLEIALDKEGYAAGETARLKVSPRFAGELLIVVGAERLRVAQKAVESPHRVATSTFP